MTTLLRDLPEPDHPLRHPIVAVGNFDGLHRGHQAIMARVVERARSLGGTSVAVTFDPHPVTVLHPEAARGVLTTLDQKLELLDALGVDLVVALPFTPAFARQSAEQFVRENLVERLHAREVYVGRNFGFGKGREGGVKDLKRIGEALGMRVVIQDPVLVDGAMVSSSAIRRLLRDGRVSDAAMLLGRPYATDGTVAHGEGRGRALGYPTANLRPGAQMLPQIGIYAAVVDDQTAGETGLDAVVYIGSQPTFGPHHVQVEAHLLTGDAPRYDHRFRIAFVAWIRGEERFVNAAALVAQITRDVAAARAALAGPNPASGRP
jgi:riboflavin kinase/FMN adenylyltransferase